MLQHIGQHVAMQCSITQQFVQVFSTRVLPILFSERERVPGGPGLIHCHPGELESARSVGRPYIERQTPKMLPDCYSALFVATVVFGAFLLTPLACSPRDIHGMSIKRKRENEDVGKAIGGNADSCVHRVLFIPFPYDPSPVLTDTRCA